MKKLFSNFSFIVMLCFLGGAMGYATALFAKARYCFWRASAKEAAFAQIEAGVDVLYAERAGVVDAAREKGILAFGNVNDMNKEENGTDVVVTSALWHMENAIDHAISRVKAGTFAAEDYKEWTMMQKGGASLAPYYEFDSRIDSDVKTKVAAMSRKILGGGLVVGINDDEPKSTY